MLGSFATVLNSRLIFQMPSVELQQSVSRASAQYFEITFDLCARYLMAEILETHREIGLLT
jgi:hypothetical protein